MGTRIFAVVLGCCLVVVNGPAWAQDGSDDAPAANVGENLIKQASEQERIRAEMAALTKNFRDLVDDMKSNGDLSDKKADEIGRLVEGISSTDANHVRKAADLLRKAYVEERANDIAARQDSLGAAGGEVQNALDKLNALLRMAKALRAGEMINAELETIIRAQEALLADTTRVGKEVLAGQDKLSLDPAKIADDQDKLAGRTSAMQDLVGVALSEEMTSDGAAQLNRAMAFLNEEKIDALMQSASRNIEQRDILAGLSEQKQALLALTRLAKLFGQDDEAAARDLAKEAHKILAKQTKLREAIEKQKEGEFKEQAANKGVEQKELQKALESLKKDLDQAPPKPPTPDAKDAQAKKNETPPGDKKGEKKDAKAAAASKKGGGNIPAGGGGPGTPQEAPKSGNKAGKKPGSPMEAAEEAGKDMEKSGEKLSERDRPGTIPNMKNAEKNLREVVKQLYEQVFLAKFPNIPPDLLKKLIDAQLAMDDKAAGMPPEPGAPADPAAALAEALAEAEKGEEAAAEKMAKAGKALKGGGEGERSAPGEGKGDPDKIGKGEGKGEGKGKSSVPTGPGGKPTKDNTPTPPQPGASPKGGKIAGPIGNLARFGKNADLLYSARDDKTTALGSSLPKRDQLVLDENFAHELPREYREMLKAYYDRLSRR